MPKLVDIVEVAEALETKAVGAASNRCVVVRHRHASCSRCMDQCPVGAVEVKNNAIAIDDGLCVACGACTTVCPTEALVPLAPLDGELSAGASASIEASGGAAVFACARIASKRRGDPAKFVAVPCLARMEEGLLLGLAAQGVRDIVLVDGTCSTCKFRSNAPLIDETLASANTLIEAMGSDVRIRRASSFPDGVLLADQRSLLGESRRGFFSSAGLRAKDAAGKTVGAMAFKKGRTEPSLRAQLQLTDAGTLPQSTPERHMGVLDAMDELGAPVVAELDTRLFGSVSIDAELCSSCDMCTVFCPTGALKKSDLAAPEGEGGYLEFSAAECVQCGLCADVCLKGCLSVGSQVSTEELFDFEPRLIHIAHPPERPGILSNLKS